MCIVAFHLFAVFCVFIYQKYFNVFNDFFFLLISIVVTLFFVSDSHGYFSFFLND